MDDDIPYLLLTPGPLTTSQRVKQAMLQDYCTWDDDYHQIVSEIRQRLVRLVDGVPDYTSVLMQGSGTFAVEATLGSVVGPSDKVLIVDNGAYGRRMVQIASDLASTMWSAKGRRRCRPMSSIWKTTCAMTRRSATLRWCIARQPRDC